ncbi:agmatinase, mitochondrial-like isoform X1 [Haliotis rufescens]|uniref:agmatinase, mitochondrial-like isoform X1 n=2 Tax=Haliotis rufescens TaxID=6454 RepID=UPI001EB07FD1|nr:agmatinase, mitochondrial-like isoform X1 [Haliotis rufescens]
MCGLNTTTALLGLLERSFHLDTGVTSQLIIRGHIMMFQRTLLSAGRLLSGMVKQSTTHRAFCTTPRAAAFNQPLSPDVLPRPAGICTMMRLPSQATTKGLDVGFIGVPLDIGVGYRNGTRMGPRNVRVESVYLKSLNASTGAAPFESLHVADVGDVRLNQYNLVTACEEIRRYYTNVECIPLTIGGDHTLTYPILQALKEKHGPMGLIQLDAHTDTVDNIAGDKICHSTPIRRAVEDGCIIPEKTVQIGIRGGGYSMDYVQWGIDQGFRVVRAEECWHKSLTPLMEEVRAMMGDIPVYVTFDIDALDPSFAPGTGALEIGGLTTIQGLEVVRGCRGLNIIGGDVVEVSPPYDNNNMTSMAAAHYLFEMLCVLPGVKYYPL